MEGHELIGPQGDHGIGSSAVVSELDLKDVVAKAFDDRAHLPPAQLFIEDVLGECDHVQDIDGWLHKDFLQCFIIPHGNW